MADGIGLAKKKRQREYENTERRYVDTQTVKPKRDDGDYDSHSPHKQNWDPTVPDNQHDREYRPDKWVPPGITDRNGAQSETAAAEHVEAYQDGLANRPFRGVSSEARRAYDQGQRDRMYGRK